MNDPYDPPHPDGTVDGAEWADWIVPWLDDAIEFGDEGDADLSPQVKEPS